MHQENGSNGLSKEPNPQIKSFAFFDLETTGLPSEENNRTKITEISLVACSTEHLLATKSGELPRVLHKLTLCFNPFKRISYKSEELTGLHNELLEHENKFDKNSVEALSRFLSHLQKPCAIVAHNGLKFDFPVLKRMLEINEAELSHYLLVADSWMIFREIDELEEFLKAEASVRPLTPQESGDESEPSIKEKEEEEIDNYIQNQLQEVVSNENHNRVLKFVNIDEEKLIDQHIHKELNEVAPELHIQKSLEIQQKLASTLRKFNETTPVKQHSNRTSPPNISKAGSSNMQGVTSERVDILKEMFNQNKKRLREFPSKSRRDLFGAKKPFKLADIYERCFQQPPQRSHYAESDVITLLKCAIAKKHDFVRIAQEQATYFKDVRPLGK